MYEGDVIISVGEPWDFSSEDGENRFLGRIIKHNGEKDELRYLIKVNKPFQSKNILVRYVVTQTRNMPKNINIYYIPDELINSFDDLNSIKDKLVFVAIGSFIS